jgi:hypothetical protein
MNKSLANNPRFLRDLLADSIRENRKLRKLITAQRAEIQFLTQRRAEFDLDADSPISCLLVRQAG